MHSFINSTDDYFFGNIECRLVWLVSFKLKFKWKMCTCQLQSLWIQSRFPLQSSSYSFIGNFECWLVDLAGIKEIKIQVQNMHLSAPVAWNSKSYFYDFQNIFVVWTRTLVLINIFPSVKITKLLLMDINSWVLCGVVEDY